MKKLIVAGLAAGVLAVMPASGFAGQTIDATHLDLDGNSCTQCHFSLDTTTGLEIVPGDTCTGCHNNQVGGYSDTAAPFVATHKGFTCQTCHNPHVSLQYGEGATPLVSGTISGADNTTSTNGNLTLTYALDPTTPGSWSADPTTWAAKTKAERGLILWETVGADNYSFKVTVADNSTIEVEGGLPVGLTFADLQTGFELHYGQLVATAIDPLTTTYRDANATTAAVTFPATENTGTIAGNYFVTSTGDGICQRCHTTTNHWQNGGADDGHNSSTTCTSCHRHDNKIGPTFGFGLGDACDVCHPNYPEPPSTGSHAIHAGTSGYAYDCVVCHKGGMSFNATPDDKIQIGFNLIPLANDFTGLHTNYDGVIGTLPDPVGYGASYEGMNGGTTSTNGSYTCSNIYCHSSGEGAQKGGKCLTGEIQGQTATSPKWDGSSVDADGNSCNNCHAKFRMVSPKELDSTGSFVTSFPDLPSVDKHYFHVVLGGIDCYSCHNATIPYPSILTATGYSVPVAGRGTHVNGMVDIQGGGLNLATPITITWDPVNQTCSTVGCHGLKTWINSPSTCVVDASNAVNFATPNVDPVVNNSCYPVGPNTIVIVNDSIDEDYIDPIKNAAANGGHDGASGLLSVYYPGDGVTDYLWQGLNEYPQGLSFIRAFKTSQLEDVNGDGSLYRGWYIYAQADNHPGSLNNMLSSPKVPGGWGETAWSSCDMTGYTGYTDVNEPVILDWTVATPGGNRIQITDKSIDPDWNDATKGHNPATSAYIGVFYNTGGVQWNPFIIDNTGADHVLPEFDYPEAVVDTLSSGGNRWVWWNYTIYENHYYNVGDTGVNISTGWQHTQLP